MNYTVIRAIEELRISQTMRIRPSEEVDAIIAEMEGWDIDAETKRADAAEAKVCELVDLATTARSTANTTGWVGNAAALVAAALDSTADIRAKWCPVRERDEAVAEAARLEKRHEESTDWHSQKYNRVLRWVREEVEPLSLAAAEHYFAIIANGSPSPFESADWTNTLHAARTAKLAAESQRDEVGVQLVAAQERLALAIETVDALSMTCLMWAAPDKIKAAKADVKFVRAALDAVPGDALGTPFDEAGTTNPAKKGGE